MAVITCMRYLLLIILLFYVKLAVPQKKWHDSSFRIPAFKIDSLEPGHIIGMVYKEPYKLFLDNTGRFTEVHTRWPLEDHYTNGQWAIYGKDTLRLDMAGAITYYKVYRYKEWYFYVKTGLESKFFKHLQEMEPGYRKYVLRRVNRKEKLKLPLPFNKNWQHNYYYRRKNNR